MTMIGMSSERWNRLTETGEALTEVEMDAGWHWCHEWDGLPIGPGMAEAICCNCGVPAVEAWKASEDARRLADEQKELNEEFEILSRQQAAEQSQLTEGTEPREELSDEEFFSEYGEDETEEANECNEHFRNNPNGD